MKRRKRYETKSKMLEERGMHAEQNDMQSRMLQNCGVKVNGTKKIFGKSGSERES